MRGLKAEIEGRVRAGLGLHFRVTDVFEGLEITIISGPVGIWMGDVGEIVGRESLRRR